MRYYYSMRRTVISALATTAALILLFANLELPADPEANLYPSSLILAVVIMVAALIAFGYLYPQRQFWVNLFITVAVIGAAILAARPIGKTIDEAIEINSQNRVAVQSGVDAADAVEFGEKSVEEVLAEFSQEYEPVQAELAKEALKEKLINHTNDLSVQDIVDPQVELIQGSWNCRAEGCAFRGTEYVFTVSTNQQWASSFLLVSGYTFLATSVWRKRES